MNESYNIHLLKLAVAFKDQVDSELDLGLEGWTEEEKEIIRQFVTHCSYWAVKNYQETETLE